MIERKAARSEAVTRTIEFRSLFFVLFFLTAGAAPAQWLTQSVEIKTGWNAVFLHVDASHLELDSWVGGDTNNPITQVWRWNPPSTAQFVDSPQDPTVNISGWSSWIRTDPLSVLERLAGDTAFLVESASDYTWEIKGQPVAPRSTWSIQGLNLIGFPTVPVDPPMFDEFLAEAPELQSPELEIYRYEGLTLSTNNPMLIPPLLYRNFPVQRGEAFWMRAGTTFNKYFGPFEVVLTGEGGVKFFDSLSTYSLRLRNLTSQELSVSMELVDSESVPTGQTAIEGVPPLLVRGPLDLNNQSYGYTELSVGSANAQTWILAARDEEGSEVEVVLGLDRSAITEDVGSLLAGILRFSDSQIISEVDLPI